MALAARPRLPRLPEPWSFFADTIVGGTLLGPVHPMGFGYTRRLNGFGSATISLPAQSSALDAERVRRLWSWRLWVFYGATPVFCAVPTGVQDEARTAVELTMTELPGYLSKRVYDVNVAGGYRYNQIEQTQIARELAAPVADVGVAIATSYAPPGVRRDRSYEYLEGGEGGRAQLLANLSEVINGPEYRVDYSSAYAGRVPACTLRIAWPRVGGEVGLGAKVPGVPSSYRAGWDSDQLRTRTFAVGEAPEAAGDQQQPPKPVAVEDRPQPDLPRLDVADDWAGVTLLTTLRERAATAAGQYAAPALALSVETGVDDPPVTSYAPGDDVQVQLMSPLMPGGLAGTGRLTEVHVSCGEGTASWTIAFTMPPPRPRSTLVQRLDALDNVTAAMFRRGAAPIP